MVVPEVVWTTCRRGGIITKLKNRLLLTPLPHFTRTILEKYAMNVATESVQTNGLHPFPASFEQPSGYPGTITCHHSQIRLPDGSPIRYCDIMEQLKYSVPMKYVRHRGAFYLKSFTGKDIVWVLMNSMKISKEEARDYCVQLMNEGVFHRIDRNESCGFDDTPHSLYRLQCYMTPDILNSFREWKIDSTLNPLQLVNDLIKIITEIKEDSFDDDGTLDYSMCSGHPMFPSFEEAVCELQSVAFSNLEQNEMLSFTLNVYNLMVQYAHIKHGIPFTECGRNHFEMNIKFVVGNLKFTFGEWVDGILRGNKNGVFTVNDRRSQLALKSNDYRVYFALNLTSLPSIHTSLPFDIFTPMRVHEQLDLASLLFFEDEQNFKVDLDNGDISINGSIGRYRDDFPRHDESFIDSIRMFMPLSLSSQVDKVIAAQSKFKIKYNDAHLHHSGKNYLRYERNFFNAQIPSLKALVQRFRPPKHTTFELERLDALRRLQVLDTPREDRFDRITHMVQTEFAVPLVLLSLVDLDRVWFKSRQWACFAPELKEISRDVSFCGHAILQNDILIISDAVMDDRFSENPLVQCDMKIRFYAGIPLSLPGPDAMMHNVGTLCLIDQHPRTMSKREIRILDHYALEIKRELLRCPI